MLPVYQELDTAVARVYQNIPESILIPHGALVLIVGLPGSGKTTFALKNFPLECVVSGDLLRTEITNNVRNQVVSDEAFAYAGGILKERLLRGRTTVVDAQNLESRARASFLRIARKYNAPIVAIVLDITAEVCMKQDAQRVRQVGAKGILSGKARCERALYSLVAERDITVYRLNDSAVTSVSVKLEDVAIYKSLPYWFDSETVLNLYRGAIEIDLRVQEQIIGRYIVVSEGGILVLEHDTPSSGIFLRRNFQPYQVLDVRVIAGRLGAEVADDAVLEFVRRMLSSRTRLNLITVLSVPKGYKRTKEILEEMMSLQKKREQRIPITRVWEGEGVGAYLTTALIRIDRRGMEDEPLALIGDVQGCLSALVEIVEKIDKENRRRAWEGKQKRRIVFVGDMADRGTFDALSVVYIIYLIRSGAALLVRGNHDDNLLRGLRDGETVPKETAWTIVELIDLTTKDERAEIVATIESMPHIAAWKHIVVAHATLPHIPRAEEKLSSRELHDITHGISTGRSVAGRREIWNLPLSCAKDPDVLIVSGHTHEQAPVIDTIAGAAVLDAGVEKRGELFCLKWPEMELCAGVESGAVRNYAILRGSKLPLSGRRLLRFIEYVATSGYVHVKKGSGLSDGLSIVSYSDMTEATDAWSRYPVLRNFRGLVIDEMGKIIARPFAKTHKAGIEIPLKELHKPAERVFEKVNGTLVMLYHWCGKPGVWAGGWRFSTKFSFTNEYTEAAEELLLGKDLSKLDTRKTYLFEIILPEDPHVVDYQGEKSLVLLNAINTLSGRYAAWNFVEQTARRLGIRSAKEVTSFWPRGTSIATIYHGAQLPGTFQNVEGFMAQYFDDDGRLQIVKIKVRGYDDKKFMRDMKWQKLLEAFDFDMRDVCLSKRLELLYYNVSNTCVREMLEERIVWIRNTYEKQVKDAEDLVHDGLVAATECLMKCAATGYDAAFREALRIALPIVSEKIKSRYGAVTKEVLNPHMGFIRSALSGKGSPADAIHRHVVKEIESLIVQETERRGKCAFWIVPEVK